MLSTTSYQVNISNNCLHLLRTSFWTMERCRHLGSFQRSISTLLRKFLWRGILFTGIRIRTARGISFRIRWISCQGRSIWRKHSNTLSMSYANHFSDFIRTMVLVQRRVKTPWLIRDSNRCLESRGYWNGSSNLWRFPPTKASFQPLQKLHTARWHTRITRAARQ